MTPEVLVATLRERGAVLLVVAGRLKVSAPPGVLMPEVLDALRVHRDAIRDFLTREGEGAPGPCVRCGRPAWPDLGAGRTLVGDLVCGDCLLPGEVALSMDSAA